MRDLGTLGAAVALVTLTTAGCGSPLEAPSGFDEERYYCDPPHAADWNEQIANCRASYLLDGSCEGLISYRGLVDSQNVVVDSQVTQLKITDSLRGDGTTSRYFSIYGRSPYFFFSFNLPDFDAPPGKSRSGYILPCNCSDGGAQAGATAVLNVEARGGTALLRMSTYFRSIQVDTPSEIKFTFSANIDRGGDVAACLDLNLPAS